MRDPSVFDGRNVWDPEELRELGFHYMGIGRGARRREG
jgi:UDPglucose 6-dehydrogenase